MFSFSLLTPLGWTYVTLHRWLHRSVQCRWRLGRKWCILLIACWLNGKSLLTRLIWVQDVSSILCTMLVCSANIWRHKSKHETCGSGLTLMRWSKVTLNFHSGEMLLIQLIYSPLPELSYFIGSRKCIMSFSYDMCLDHPASIINIYAQQTLILGTPAHSGK